MTIPVEAVLPLVFSAIAAGAAFTAYMTKYLTKKEHKEACDKNDERHDKAMELSEELKEMGVKLDKNHASLKENTQVRLEEHDRRISALEG